MRSFPIVALFVTVAGVTYAAAPVDYGNGLVPYKVVGKWQVHYDPSLRGCGLSTFDNGTQVRFGFNNVYGADQYPTYINDKWWTQFKLNEGYRLEVGFDEKPSHQYQFWTHKENWTPKQKKPLQSVMLALLPDDAMLSEVAQSTTVTISYWKKLATVELGKRISEAIDILRACQKTHVTSS
jgi:hypothetical protein